LVDREDLFSYFDTQRAGVVHKDEFVSGMRDLRRGGPVGSLVFPEYPAKHLPPRAVEALYKAGYHHSAEAAKAPSGTKAGKGARDPEISFMLNNEGPDGEPGPPITKRVPIRIPLTHPRMRGGMKFFGDVPENKAVFGPSELCATPGPVGSLAPEPEIATKTWYNTYVYVEEERSAIKDGGQFLERFVQGPDGEWLDVPKAQRMAWHIKDQAEKAAAEKEERRAIEAGEVWSYTAQAYTDAYSGKPLVEYNGKLMPKEELFNLHNCHESEFTAAWRKNSPQFDLDNFRAPWPGAGPPLRNKMVSQAAYDWFDRQNPFIPSDRSYQFVELPSSYVDAERYSKWRDGKGETPLDHLTDAYTRVCSPIDDYPYQI
jgi:hypothetical protein